MVNVRLPSFVVFMLLLLTTTATFAVEVETRSYPLPDHGVIQLKVPRSWQSKVSQPPNNLPPTITFASEKTISFQVLLTPLWAGGPGIVLPGPTEIKSKIEKTIETIKPQSVEREIPIRELKGIVTRGYYFSVTDKAPNPGEFKYMTQGMLRLGELLVTFTALTNDGSGNIVGETISMLETAQHRQDESRTSDNGALRGRADSIQIVQREYDYVMTVPVSRLMMMIPRAGFTRKDNAAGGSTSHPRYFYFEDSSNHLLVSGWFEAEQGYKGIQAFWADEVATWRKNGLPEPHNVSIAKIGNWDAIAYNLTVPNGVNEHIRAHWTQSGTWIDIHLSLSTTGSNEDARARLTAFLTSIAITERK